MTETATPTRSEVRTYGHVIDGIEQPPSAQLVERHSPATGALVARYSSGTADDALAAISAARAAFDSGPWPAAAGQHRSRVLNRLADLMRRDAEQLARIEAVETGKPLRLARGDVQASIGLTEYAAALALTMHGDVHTNLGEGFTGLVTRVVRDTVMAQVEIQAGPHRFVSLLSREAVDELGLEAGVLAVAAVKATNVSVEIPRLR